jgi:hypothetical protein
MLDQLRAAGFADVADRSLLPGGEYHAFIGTNVAV